MKGIVLAGGTGSRLWPITKAVSKQLLPIYDKPMIYYPLATLMLAGIREILVITTPQDQAAFYELLGTGEDFGIEIAFKTQPKPEGLAQAFVLGEEFLNGDSSLMILGDNIFHGVGLGHELSSSLPNSGAHIFTYEVANPNQYGILTLDSSGKPISIVEKPQDSKSNLAVTGLYYFDNQVCEVAKNVVPSARGELEITSVIQHYLDNDQLSVTPLSRGTAWLDTGNPNGMHDASSFIKVIEERTGLKIGCLEEISWRNGWLSDTELIGRSEKLAKSSYGTYLRKLIAS